MNVTSLQHKTVRPGSLSGYAYYYSGRQARRAQAVPKKPRSKLGLKVLATLLVVGVIIGVPLLRGEGITTSKQPTSTQPVITPQTNPTATTPAAALPQAQANQCAGNTQDKLIKVSVGQRHLWACQGDKVAHDTPVITGLETIPANHTPRGSYKIYAKQTNTTLKGSDARGSWNRPVHYWMPFLDNEHGTYGFHDATWKPNNAFGNVDPNTSDEASRGCVELPLGSSKWLYEWAPVHTPVIVEN